MDSMLVYWLLLSFGPFLFWNVDGHYRARRVINGTEAVPHSSPWMAMLVRSDGGMCGSFLISRNMVADSDAEDHSSDIVLTSAHCFLVHKHKYQYLDGSTSKAKVIFGKHRKFEEGPAEFSVDVVAASIHPNFRNERLNKTDPSSDIAVLQLRHSVAYDNYTMPIRLETKHQDAYKDCYLAGWGVSSKRQKVKALNVIRFKEVIFNHTGKFFQASTKLQCPHNGDSGSTLVCQQQDHPVAVGLLYGNNFTLSIFPSIHRHWNWIKKIVDETEKAAAYRSNLVHYVENMSTNEEYWLEIEDYLKAVYEMLPNTLPFELSSQPKTTIAINDAMIDRMHKYLKVQYGFCFGEIISHTVIANAEECATQCYNENHLGACNYIAINNGCFFMNKSTDWSTATFETPIALCMQFKDA